MKSLMLVLSFILTLGLSAAAFAGGPDVPPPPDHSGFFLGIGGSWNSIDVEHRTAGFPIRDFNNEQNKFAPTAQMGYWGNMGGSGPHPWMWGVEFLYKYLNAYLHVNIPFGGPGLGVDDYVGHEVALLVLFGRQFTDHLFGYIGAGAVYFPPVRVTGSLIPNVFTFSNDAWGGIGRIGVIYYLPHHWFLDFAYAYAHTGGANIVMVGNVSSEIHVVNQEFIFTLNRQF